jgi:hypothetical protein
MTRRLRDVLLLVACVTPATASLAGCGGGEDPAATKFLQQTFGRDGPAIHDGYLSLSVRLVPPRSPAAGGPVTVTLLGPFRAAPAPGGLERFNVEVATMLARRTSVARVRSTGTRIAVTRDTGASRVADRLAARLRASGARPGGGGLPVVGLDPRRWIRGAQTRRRERAVGVDTIRLGGAVDVARLLGDVDDLLADAAGSPVATALLSPQRRRAVAGAVDWSTIDIWTGASDRLLRQISARVDFTLGRRPAAVRAVTRATLEVHVRLDDVNGRPTVPRAGPGGRASPR